VGFQIKKKFLEKLFLKKCIMTSVDIQQMKSGSGVKLSNGSRQQSSKRKNIILKELPISVEDLTDEGNQCYAFKIKYSLLIILYFYS
jgi:hypothetical protein